MFEAVSYEGEPAESEEMRPQWFNEAKVPLKVCLVSYQSAVGLHSCICSYPVVSMVIIG